MNRIYINKSISNLENIIPKNSGVYIILDNNLKHLSPIFSKYQILCINASESTKTLQTVEKISNWLLEKGADREAFLIGVGGGITTDITGFVASIYKRGVKFAFIPTTLLAQVDASIGGKNGVNFNAYKNIIGVINQPLWIYHAIDTLDTLEEREFKAGIAEVIKTFILFDKEYYKKAIALFANKEENKEIYKEKLLDIIKKCAEYKCGVVKRDEFEKGERRLLNLGHTFAHAIEKIYAECNIMHGYAVSIGMVIAANITKVAYKESVEEGFANMLALDLQKVGLPISLDEIDSNIKVSLADLFNAIIKDKKVSGNSIHFIAPFGIENVKDITIELEQLKTIINDLC